MLRWKTVLGFVAVAAVAVALAAAAKVLMDKREVAIATVDDIEAQLSALDPVTRAGVIARLSKDAAEQVRSLR